MKFDASKYFKNFLRNMNKFRYNTEIPIDEYLTVLDGFDIELGSIENRGKVVLFKVNLSSNSEIKVDNALIDYECNLVLNISFINNPGVRIKIKYYPNKVEGMLVFTPKNEHIPNNGIYFYDEQTISERNINKTDISIEYYDEDALNTYQRHFISEEEISTDDLKQSGFSPDYTKEYSNRLGKYMSNNDALKLNKILKELSYEYLLNHLSMLFQDYKKEDKINMVLKSKTK